MDTWQSGLMLRFSKPAGRSLRSQPPWVQIPPYPHQFLSEGLCLLPGNRPSDAHQQGPKALLGVPRAASRLVRLSAPPKGWRRAGLCSVRRWPYSTANVDSVNRFRGLSMSDGQKLTLRKALETGQIDRFVKQAEADGVGPAEGGDFDQAVRHAVKPKRSADQTSRSASRDGSSGK